MMHNDETDVQKQRMIDELAEKLASLPAPAPEKKLLSRHVVTFSEREHQRRLKEKYRDTGYLPWD